MIFLLFFLHGRVCLLVSYFRVPCSNNHDLDLALLILQSVKVQVDGEDMEVKEATVGGEKSQGMLCKSESSSFLLSAAPEMLVAPQATPSC